MKIGLILLLLYLGGCWGRSAGPPVGQFFEPICEQLWPQGHGPIDGERATKKLLASYNNYLKMRLYGYYSPSGQQPGDGGFQVLTNLTRDNAGGFIYSSGETYSGKYS